VVQEWCHDRLSQYSVAQVGLCVAWVRVRVFACSVDALLFTLATATANSLSAFSSSVSARAIDMRNAVVWVEKERSAA
jgi:hypothetical protein